MNYHIILRQIALRANAIIGPQPSTLETNYKTLPLTDSLFDSGVFPFTAIKDALQSAEDRLAKAVASIAKHPWRAFLLSTTANLAHNAVIPSGDSTGKQIIGVYGDVLDATDSRKLTWKPASYVERRVAMTTFVIPTYNFNADGDRLLHTRAAAKIKVCVYDWATQRAAIDANTAMLLPDAAEWGLVSGGVGELVRDDEFLQQSKVFRDDFDAFISNLGAMAA